MCQDALQQTSLGVFAQTDVEWLGVLRTTLGVRADAYRFDVRSDNPLNEPSTGG